MNIDGLTGQEKQFIQALNDVIKSRFIMIRGKNSIILTDSEDVMEEGWFFPINTIVNFKAQFGDNLNINSQFQVGSIQDKNGIVITNIQTNESKTPYISGAQLICQTDLIDLNMRILFRLTQKPNGSMVPIYDLLDAPGTNTSIFIYPVIKYLWKKASEIVPCPIGYDPINAVFKKEDNTFSIIEHLRLSFAEWNQNNEKKT